MNKLIIPEMKDFGRFYLSKDPVLENGKPKTEISWWDAWDYLASNEFRLPTLYETWYAAQNDPEIKDSVFSYSGEWQGQFILNPDTEPNSKNPQGDKFLIKDADEKNLKKLKWTRIINPIEIHLENDTYIIKANAYSMPFKIVTKGKYNPKDLDPETGFFKKLDPNGEYNVDFRGFETSVWSYTYKGLFAVFLNVNGDLICSFKPHIDIASTAFRAALTKK